MEQRTGHYRKSGNMGRAWHISVNGEERPVPGQPVTIYKRNGGVDNVTVREVISTGSPWICTFKRVWDNAQEQQTHQTVSGSDYLSDNDGEKSAMDGSQQAQNIAQATQAALPENAQQAIAALQALFGGFDENKVRQVVHSAIQDAIRQAKHDADEATHRITEAYSNVMDAEKRTRSMAEDLPKLAVEALAKAAANAVGSRVEYVDVTGKVADCGRQHERFADLLRYISIGLNVWLPGPAGSGKTTAARMVAKALDLPFYHAGKVLMEHQLIGYMDAHGKYHGTPFRTAYEFGGVFLQDEADGSEAKALLALNMAIENGEMAFPDGIVKRHDNFRLIAAANTFGMGADSDYVGRNQQDKAFLDRFVTLAWNYDEAFELHLALQQWDGATQWVDRVQSLRRAAKAKGIRVLITPRASILGAKMLKAGIPLKDAEQGLIRKGMSEEQWNSIRGA